MQELIEELDNCEKNINELAPQLIHKHEVIMTYGLPTSVHKLLLRAAMKNPDFTIVVVEGNPNVMNHTHGAVMNKVTGDEEEGSNSEQQAARKSLQDRGVKVVVVSDADVWNMISRVNKVFLGANYVLADGAVIAAAGAGGVARMARGMRKPVVVVAGSHMLCPVLCFEKGEMVEMGKPVTVGFNEGDLMANAEFPNPLNDYIEPTKIAMFVTNK